MTTDPTPNRYQVTDLSTADPRRMALSERAAWRTACLENGVDDPPDCYGWSSSALWIWHALVTFVRLHQLPVMGELAARNLATAHHPHRSLAS